MELALLTRLALNSQRSVCPLSAGIKDVCHYGLAIYYYYLYVCVHECSFGHISTVLEEVRRSLRSPGITQGKVDAETRTHVFYKNSRSS